MEKEAITNKGKIYLLLFGFSVHYSLKLGAARKIVEASFQTLENLEFLHRYEQGGYTLFIFEDGIMYNLVYNSIDPERRRYIHYL